MIRCVYFPKISHCCLFCTFGALRRTTRIHKRRKFESTLPHGCTSYNTYMSYVSVQHFSCVCFDGFINVDCSVLTSIHITYVYTNTRQYLMFGVPLSLLFTRFYLYIRVCVSERFFCPNAARNQASFPFRKYWEEHISLLTVDSGIKIEQKQILYDFIV